MNKLYKFGLGFIAGIILVCGGYETYVVADYLLGDNKIQNEVSAADIYNTDTTFKTLIPKSGALDKYIEDETLYELAYTLMDQGYSDVREPFYISDDDYCNWRYDNMPVQGVSQGKSTALTVTAGDEYVTEDDIQYVNDCLASMPKTLTDRMAKDKWKIIVTSGDLGQSAEGHTSVTIGEQNPYKKTITVDATSPTVIYHEVGHVVEDYAKKELESKGYLTFSREGELAKLYCHSAWGSVYVYLNPMEQLAESFYDFIWYPREMKAQAPQLYSIIEKTVNAEM